MKTCPNLYDKLTSFKTLYKSYQKVKKHKKENKFIQAFEYKLEENILNLQQDLRNFTYRSSRMKRLLIPNRPSRKPIYSGCLEDRIVQQAIRMVIYPIFHKTFDVFGPKGIPIGSPLSQTLANIYLNELDYFIKYSLKHKYYIRFADDFTILDKENLTKTKEIISSYLWQSLLLTLHPQKTILTTTNKGVNLLGYKIFYFYKRIKNKNLQKFKEKMRRLQEEYSQGLITQERLTQKIRGWVEYARYANTYNLRKTIFSKYKFVKKVENIPKILSSAR